MDVEGMGMARLTDEDGGGRRECSEYVDVLGTMRKEASCWLEALALLPCGKEPSKRVPSFGISHPKLCVVDIFPPIISSLMRKSLWF